MSRLAQRFATLANTGRKALIPYLTTGDPNLAATVDLAAACEQGGADVLELGIPFSNPVADGPTIQAAAKRALAAGATPSGVLQVVAKIREKSDIPIVLLSYVNTVFSQGLGVFFAKCAEAGVDGLVIPDLPAGEAGSITMMGKEHGLDIIRLAAPTSPEEHIAAVTKDATGFVYCVSVSGVTGARDSLPASLGRFLSMVRQQTSTPLAVGFGISRPEQAKEIVKHADGIIIGSALINRVHESLEKAGLAAATAATEMFLRGFREALDSN